MQSDGIIIFDVETTGTDRRRDQVIELSVQFGLGGDSNGNGNGNGNGHSRAPKTRTWRVKPSVPIKPDAQAIHGISMEDLADCPSFGAPGGAGEQFREIWNESEILVGYNLGFDIEMLQAEYERLGQPALDLTGKFVVDPLRLWQQCEPRTLQEAHKRFVGNAFDEAHSASADVAATGRVLRGMMSAFGIEAADWRSVAKVCEPQRATWVGPSRHVRWAADGSPVLSFGKHSGTPLHELAQSSDQGYLRWVVSKDFPPHVQDICTKALELDESGFMGWVKETFGPPPSRP